MKTSEKACASDTSHMGVCGCFAVSYHLPEHATSHTGVCGCFAVSYRLPEHARLLDATWLF